MTIKVLLFDIGGVLLTNGWDRDSRAEAAAEFGLDLQEFSDRHAVLADAFETGKLTLDEYLTRAVFHTDRDFTPSEFAAFMKDQSRPYPNALDLVRRLAATGHYLLATLNNESRELNDHRISEFELGSYFGDVRGDTPKSVTPT